MNRKEIKIDYLDTRSMIGSRNPRHCQTFVPCSSCLSFLGNPWVPSYRSLSCPSYLENPSVPSCQNPWGPCNNLCNSRSCPFCLVCPERSLISNLRGRMLDAIFIFSSIYLLLKIFRSCQLLPIERFTWKPMMARLSNSSISSSSVFLPLIPWNPMGALFSHSVGNSVFLPRIPWNPIARSLFSWPCGYSKLYVFFPLVPWKPIAAFFSISPNTCLHNWIIYSRTWYHALRGFLSRLKSCRFNEEPWTL